MLQQKIHRERLEQLNQVKNEQIQQLAALRMTDTAPAVQVESYALNNQNEAILQLVNQLRLNAAQKPVSDQFVSSNQNLFNQQVHLSRQPINLHELVAKQQQLKYVQVESRAPIGKVKMDDEFIIGLVNRKNLNDVKSAQESYLKLNKPDRVGKQEIKHSNSSFIVNQENSGEDAEESKLIEDLFFLKH